VVGESPPGEPERGYNPIFEKLVGTGEGQNLQGLIAYGLYKISKREWVSEFRARKGRKPTDEELDAYVETWTASQLHNVRERAAQVLAEYASTVIQAEEPRILRGAVKGTFWRGAGQSVVGAFLYTLLLIALTVILALAGIDLVGILRSVAAS